MEPRAVMGLGVNLIYVFKPIGRVQLLSAVIWSRLLLFTAAASACVFTFKDLRHFFPHTNIQLSTADNLCVVGLVFGEERADGFF